MFLLLACASPSPAESPSPNETSPRDTGALVDSALDSDAAESAPIDSQETGDDSRTTREDSPETGDTAGNGDEGGPCTAYATAVAMGSVQDPALDELSGLAVSRLNPGILWTHEDSGGAADLYALDAFGATVATVHVEGVENEDWEDIAVAPCDAGWCLQIGDVGDLGTDRDVFSVLLLEEPLLDGASAYTVVPEVRSFTYPGDPEDAEGLAILPDGSPLVVTKRENASAGLYRLAPGATVLEWLSDVQTGVAGEDLTARATAADLSEDGATLLLRTYLHLYAVPLSDLLAPGTPLPIAFALELQGEAVAWDPLQGGFWQVSEGVGQTLFYTGCE